MSVTSRPGPMTTASSGTPSSRATEAAAAAQADPAIPVISVNRSYGARSRVDSLRVLPTLELAPTQTCGSRAPGTVDGWKYSSGSRSGSGRTDPSETIAVDA